MSKSDQLICVILGITILLYFSVLIRATISRKASLFTLLNVVSAITVVIYWVQKQLRITVHITDSMEIAMLYFEITVIGLGIYSILSRQSINWLDITHKVVFGIHLSALILFLTFMLIFKITRLI